MASQEVTVRGLVHGSRINAKLLSGKPILQVNELESASAGIRALLNDDVNEGRKLCK